MYNVIIVGGISFDVVGRALGPFRLRTALEDAGYPTKVIDYASALTEDQMLLLLEKLITDKTIVLGISSAWFDRMNFSDANIWVNDSFFKKFRDKYPSINIVIGGTKLMAHPLLYHNTDWFLTGFSDISFVQLLHSTGIKIIQSDTYYKVENMDLLETVFKKEDNFLPHQPLTIEIARGCIFKCSFCTHPFLGKKSYDYIKTAENLAVEFKRNYELFGTTRYFFSDDTFNDSIEKIDRVKRAIDIAKLPSFEFVGYIKPELLVTTPEMIPMLKDIGLRGAHFGIESLNQRARKLIGKGMEVQKIFDVAEKLQTSNDVKINASLILGLPGDTVSDFNNWQSFLTENQERLFSSWKYHSLGITQSGYSLIEKNPLSYGYTVEPISNSVFFAWRNDTGLTSGQCLLIEQELNKQTNKVAKMAGWTLGSAWFFNIPQDDIENKCFNEIDLSKIAKTQSTIRALKEYWSIIDN